MDQQNLAAKNRRLAKRKLPKRGIQVVCQKGLWGLGPNLAISVLDVSEAGIRLILKSPLERRQEFLVTLSAPGNGKIVKAVAKVAWSVETAEGTYCVGASFEKRMAYIDLLTLVSASSA